MARVNIPATVSAQLQPDLRLRVARAMEAMGTDVFSEFLRQALTDKCRRVEQELARDHPEDHRRIYGDDRPSSAPPHGG